MTKTERETMAEMQYEMDNLKDEVAGLKMDAMDSANQINDLMVQVVDLTTELDGEEEDHRNCISERDELQDKLNGIDNDLCNYVDSLDDVLGELRALYHSI